MTGTDRSLQSVTWARTAVALALPIVKNVLRPVVAGTPVGPPPQIEPRGHPGTSSPARKSPPRGGSPPGGGGGGVGGGSTGPVPRSTSKYGRSRVAAG